MEKTTVASTCVRLGVYFGSFDPIHCNHLALCQYLLGQNPLQLDRIYLVANQNNPLKPYMVPHQDRSQMVFLAIQASGQQERLIPYHSLAVDQYTWDGRDSVCQEILALPENPPGSQIYQIMGQDSYEKALQRCQMGQGIHKSRDRHLLIFPRDGEEAMTIRAVPDHLKGHVTVVTDYRDPQTCSSTTIRDALRSHHESEVRSFLEPSVMQYILQHRLYAPRLNHRRIIAIMGSPGSGKGTLSQHLIRFYPRYQHIASGELYRQAQMANNQAYRTLQEAQSRGPIVYKEALHQFILRQLKSMIDPSRRYIIDGLKPNDLYDFEQQIAPIDAIVVLNCQYGVAQQRLLQRRRDDDTTTEVKKRLDNYYRYLWIQRETLDSYAGTGRWVINLNSQGPPQQLPTQPIWRKLLIY